MTKIFFVISGVDRCSLWIFCIARRLKCDKNSAVGLLIVFCGLFGHRLSAQETISIDSSETKDNYRVLKQQFIDPSDTVYSELIEQKFIGGVWVNHGVFTRQSANSKKLIKAKYIQGQLDSVVTIWHPNGVVKRRQEMVNGKEGIARCFDERGKKINCQLPLEKSPEFPGGESGLYAFIRKTLIYPQVAIDNNIQGKVIVKFVVDTDGIVNNIQVVKKAHEVLDAEAVRVTSLLPKWKPGIFWGEYANCYYAIPYVFRLQ